METEATPYEADLAFVRNFIHSHDNIIAHYEDAPGLLRKLLDMHEAAPGNSSIEWALESAMARMVILFLTREDE